MDCDLGLRPVQRCPTAGRPLQGLTILLVEDSRFACEALRLMAHASGARIRRADNLGSARRHLACYQPSVVFVDIGLPDGSGTELLAEMAGRTPRPALVAISADDNAGPAILAGADRFVPKPLQSISAFQQIVIECLPPERQPRGLRLLPAAGEAPDRLTLREDLMRISQLLATTDERGLDYAAQFSRSVAKQAPDPALHRAGTALRQTLGTPQQRRCALALRGLVEQRLRRDDRPALNAAG